MTIVNQISYHGYIFYVLNIVFLTKKSEKSCLFMSFLTVMFFSKNIQGNFTLILPLKKLKSQKLLPIIIRNINRTLAK